MFCLNLILWPTFSHYKTIITSRNKSIHKSLFLWADHASIALHSIREHHDGHAHVEGGMYEIVPEPRVGNRSNKVENDWRRGTEQQQQHCISSPHQLLYWPPNEPNCSNSTGSTNRNGPHNKYSWMMADMAKVGSDANLLYVGLLKN